MSGKSFLDTNILFYAYDGKDPRKQAIAAKLCADLARTGKGVISSQVGQELLANLVRKLKVSPVDARMHIEALRDYEFVPATLDLMLSAQDLMARHSFSIWDAMIVAAAVSAGCNELLSEDMQEDAVIQGVLIRNPFSE